MKELVRGSVEETLNGLLEAEAEKLTQAGRYERSEQRQGYRSGHYSRSLATTAGEVTLQVPRLKGISFETAIIERYRRREFSVVPKTKVKNVALMLKAIHAQESRDAALKKAEAVAEKLRSMKLKEAAKKVFDSFEETLTYMSFPSEH